MKSSVVALAALLLLLGRARSRPNFYDQRQDGDTNIHAHLENILILLIPSSGGSLIDLKVAKEAPVNRDEPRANEQSGGNEATAVTDPSDENSAQGQKNEGEGASLNSAKKSRSNEEYRKDSPSREPDVVKERVGSSEPTQHDASPSSAEAKDSEAKSSNREASHAESSEEVVAETAPEDAQSGRTTKEARFIDFNEVESKKIANLKRILSEGVEPCQLVSSQGLCLAYLLQERPDKGSNGGNRGE